MHNERNRGKTAVHAQCAAKSICRVVVIVKDSYAATASGVALVQKSAAEADRPRSRPRRLVGVTARRGCTELEADATLA